MKLGYVIIYVPDVLQALAFYEKAFELKRNFVSENAEYGELDTGNTKLSFVAESLIDASDIRYTKNRIQNLSAGIEIALVTDNVASAYDFAIKQGAVAVKAPITKPWGQTVAYLKDLNNILVELCSPIG